MVVGSTIKDIEKVKTPTTQELRAESQAEGKTLSCVSFPVEVTPCAGRQSL